MSMSYNTYPPLSDLHALREYFGISTPAPWAFDEEGRVWVLRGFPPQKELIAEVKFPTELDADGAGLHPDNQQEWGQGRMDSNTRLITAAPQLLNSFIKSLEKEEELLARIEQLLERLDLAESYIIEPTLKRDYFADVVNKALDNESDNLG